MRALAVIGTALLDQRGHLFPWAPVFLAVGIGAYFTLPVEPGPGAFAAAVSIGTLAAVFALWRPGAFSPLLWAVSLLMAGFCLAGVRAHSVAAPMLDWRYYGSIEGRVVAIDRSASDALRITLDQVILKKTAPARRPGRVRISLHGTAASSLPPRPGDRVMTTGHLSPPGGPAEPGGFDFRRHAWFQGLGAVGYTRLPVLRVDTDAGGSAAIRVFAIRMAISEAIRTALPGDTGGFAAAVTTGDRSGVGQDTLSALRVSNLAHLLAISGLHMGLLAGVVFGLLRLIFAAVPPLALRWPVRRIAAGGALLASCAYLVLSGGNVATERAFIMVAVMLTALFLDRRALSLRAVAMAALIVLTLRPEALLGPGFQMSFAATTALVVVFGALRDLDRDWCPAWLRPVLGIVISSAVAGAATAPVAAAHFNALAAYGLPANLVSVPVMGTVVIPAAVAAACLWPLGLEAPALWIMGQGLDWILYVARFVSEIEGARRPVVSPPFWVLPVLGAAMLWAMLWQFRARWLGLVPACVALLFWTGTERPQVLVAENGGLVGVMTDRGRALSRPRGSGFVAGIWLENDGDSAMQPDAASRWPGQGRIRRHMLGNGRELVHLSGKRAVAAFAECRQGQIIVASVPFRRSGDCDVYDPEALRRTGALSIDHVDGATRVTAARDVSGDRLWNRTKRRNRPRRFGLWKGWSQ